MEIVKHANFIEYLAKKNIHIVEKKAKGQKFLHLSKPLEEDLRKKIINNLLRNYADVDSINRAIEDYRFENKLDKKKKKRSKK
jgi:DNA-binding cell septation regulator SpoVG